VTPELSSNLLRWLCLRFNAPLNRFGANFSTLSNFAVHVNRHRIASFRGRPDSLPAVIPTRKEAHLAATGRSRPIAFAQRKYQ
jgi:hypothetical protein